MKLDSIMPKRVDPATISFVKTAFDQKISGSNQRYELLLKIITTKTDVNALMSLLEAVSQCMNYFESNDSKLGGFVTTIFQIRWEMNIELAKRCCNFATGIAAINGKYYIAMYTMLIKHLYLDYDNQSEEKKEIDELVHDTIQSILKIAPLSNNALFQVCQDSFPHNSAPVELQTYYLKNLLKILSYAPMIRDRSIAVIIEKLTAIDVEIHIEDSKLSKKGVLNVATEEHDNDDVFQADWDNEANKEEDDSVVMAEKLDQLMILMFQYIDQTKAEGKEALDKLFHTLQRCFEYSVMLTHKSKHVQFLLFYICQYDHSYLEQYSLLSSLHSSRFVGRMIDWICSEEAIPLYRQTCAAYCASFICRAQYVDLDIIKSVLYYLISWVQAYIDVYNHQEHPLYPGSEGHKVFYSIVQSVCYIMCFCGRKIYYEGKGKQFIKQWRWTEMMDSTLEPLRFCISSITTEFVYLCMELNLIDFCECHTYYINYLYTYLHSNSLEEEIQNSKKTTIGSGENPLESFFPYDPYLLRESSKFIDPLYVYWEDIVDKDEHYMRNQNSDSDASNDFDIDHELSTIFESSLAQSFAVTQGSAPAHVLLSSKVDSTSSVLSHKRSMDNSSLYNDSDSLLFASKALHFSSLDSGGALSEAPMGPDQKRSKMESSVDHGSWMSNSEEIVVNEDDEDNDPYDYELVELSFTRTRKASDVGSW